MGQVRHVVFKRTPTHGVIQQARKRHRMYQLEVRTVMQWSGYSKQLAMDAIDAWEENGFGINLSVVLVFAFCRRQRRRIRKDFFE